MPWPEKVIRQFQTSPPNPVESDFLGAYNRLLYTLFSLALISPVPRKLSDYIITFEVLQNRSVFILKLNKPADLTWISSRQAADVQIRQTLHAVSAMGTRLCFCPLNIADVPTEIISHNIPRIVNDTAPMERWDYDVLDSGEGRLRAVVDSIKAACENIANA
ncbi:hypothetical protein BS47DRAFT_1302035 [Hydnum rufescens UP504]|uniref:Uncharacterized protein n=1 Tax=Hydnum rufescens UP504 TaxID=1448309 RepID=A0A9P6ANI0_9AGAM|nr:hypothetical protein BS47DRAFT_1302035 [Hydnum rufescens UP504]